jgi:hypothetical protein
MENGLIQLWELQDGKFLSDGCSLHLTESDRDLFIKKVDNKFEKPIGKTSEILVCDKIFEILELRRSIRLSENEMNNLIGMGDIKIIH